ncbi:tyrosine-type recombinase/integrase [Streptomyces sparsogenes]|uniref:tyrosine-type recombinase/integrase n=1 Tax=Streptomyces sparsogenes TaxID=67365 RepID=UPI0033C0EE5F
MANRARDRQPLLPILSQHANGRWHRLRTLLDAALTVENGEVLQNFHGGTRRGMSSTTVWRLIGRARDDLALTHPQFKDIRFAPHDFRRLFATELVNNGLPIHIGAALLGHLDIRTTRGYVAVFEEDVISNYHQFLARRRAERPKEEYRDPTPEEWSDFQEHFDKRRIELGSCGRPCGTPCTHEQADARLHPLPDAQRQPQDAAPDSTRSRRTSWPAASGPSPRDGKVRSKG